MAELKPRLRTLGSGARDLWRWRGGGWSSPACPPVKRQVLKRAHIPGATWIETGTYRGDTTDFLSRLGADVISIEPDPLLYAQAVDRFHGNHRIHIVNGTSEDVLAEIVRTEKGALCFWLDGHYSGGGTHLAKSETPIIHELAVIEENLPRFREIAVLVDDFREFPPTNSQPRSSGYPTRDFLVEWANRNGLIWNVEHDIFIARAP